MPRQLLPQQPAPVTPQQRALTRRLVEPHLQALTAMLLTLRAEVDAVLAPRMPMLSGKPYPLARCRQVTEEVSARLRARIQQPDGHAAQVLRRFIEQGGIVRPIWGALRGLYFQNALQVGRLYVDVANDTVVATKPQVEILPLAESGFEALRGPAHFAEIAERYWDARLFANHALPDLAPLLPMISLKPGEAPKLQSATDYMVDLLRRDGFKQSEEWLVSGPPPPPEAVEDLRRRGAEAFGVMAPIGADPGVAAAVDACRAARRAGAHRDESWREARLRDYLQVRAQAQDGTEA